MAERPFTPFADDSAVQTLGDLTIENAPGGWSAGALDLARDRRSLERARALGRIVEAVVKALEGHDLPERAEAPPATAETVKNPFG